MDLELLSAKTLDLPKRVLRRLRGPSPDYRALLFEELKARLAEPPARVLEIGPKDGDDTRRLLGLRPGRLVLIDLPDKEVAVGRWIGELQAPNVDLIIGNIMYDERAASLEPFDLVWCTGVIYHNPEQLRMLRRLYELTRPGGLLVLESATARRPALRNQNCVEIWHGESEDEYRKYHVSKNITHLPTGRALRSWLELIGFDEIRESACHRNSGRELSLTRHAFIVRRPTSGGGGIYYAAAGGYTIGTSR